MLFTVTQNAFTIQFPMFKHRDSIRHMMYTVCNLDTTDQFHPNSDTRARDTSKDVEISLSSPPSNQKDVHIKSALLPHINDDARSKSHQICHISVYYETTDLKQMQ